MAARKRKEYAKGYSIAEIVDLVRNSKDCKVLDDIGCRYSLIMPLCTTEQGLLELISAMDYVTGRKVYSRLRDKLEELEAINNPKTKRGKKVKAKAKAHGISESELIRSSLLRDLDG